MIWLLANWKTILFSVATAGIAYLLHVVDVNHLQKERAAALENQLVEDNKHCAEEKAITEGVSDDYSKKITDLNSSLDALRLREPTACITPTSNPTPRNNGSSKGAIPAGKNGVTSSALFDFAAEAEKYRIQLIDCQSFITQTWALENE